MLAEKYINTAKDTPLVYRSKLTIPRTEKFGLEIEIENVDYKQVYTLVKKQFGVNWKVKKDKSLQEGRSAEIVTPLLKNTKETWLLLKEMGRLLEKLNPTFQNASFQVNFDGHLLPTIEDRIRFLKLYAFYEDIIYRFSKGEDEEYRESIEMYASPIILSLKDVLPFEKEYPNLILEKFNDNKRYGISFKVDGQDVIEFRTPNGTKNPIYWQNYITMFYYLLRLATSHKYNKQEIDAYINSFSKLYILESYSLPREKKAITLSKQLYRNTKDQMYFLHQYRGIK